MQKALLKQCGVAEDGKPVFAGLFRFRETYGLPLEVVISVVIQDGGVVGWLELFDEMVAASVKSPFSVIDDALGLAFDPATRQHISTELRRRRGAEK